MEFALLITVTLMLGAAGVLLTKARQLETLAGNTGELPAGMTAWLP